MILKSGPRSSEKITLHERGRGARASRRARRPVLHKRTLGQRRALLHARRRPAESRLRLTRLRRRGDHRRPRLLYLLLLDTLLLNLLLLYLLLLYLLLLDPLLLDLL